MNQPIRKSPRSMVLEPVRILGAFTFTSHFGDKTTNTDASKAVGMRGALPYVSRSRPIRPGHQPVQTNRWYARAGEANLIIRHAPTPRPGTTDGTVRGRVAPEDCRRFCNTSSTGERAAETVCGVRPSTPSTRPPYHSC